MRRPIGLVFVVALLAGCGGPPAEPEDATPAQPVATWAGSYQAALVWPQPYPVVEVVVHAQSGYEPAAPTREAVISEFGRLLEKEVRLRVVETVGGPSGTSWTRDQLQALAAEAKKEPWPPGVALMHVFSMGGCYEYNSTRGCIGGSEIDDVAFALVDDYKDLETLGPYERDLPYVGWYSQQRYLFVHELGHAVGLVEVPLPSEREPSPEDGCRCHSQAEDSVMFHRHRGVQIPTEFEELDRVLDDRLEHYWFGADDLADVRAFRSLAANPVP